MKKFETKSIRNLALVGSKGVGKTTFTEGVLFTAKATTRMGRVAEGNSIIDYDPLEVERQQTISSKVVPFEWKGVKINLIDTPGYADFVGEAVGAINVADVAVFLIDSVNGVEIQTTLLNEYVKRAGAAKAFFINKADAERADVDAAFESIKEKIDPSAVMMQMPIGAGPNFKGVVDLLRMQAYQDGKAGEIPADLVAAAKEKRTALMEAVAESSEELLNKYLEVGELSEQELMSGIAKGVASGGLALVFLGSAHSGLALEAFLDTVAEDFPSPADMPPVKAKRKDGSEVELAADASGPLLARVFKTTSDPGIGDIFYFRVYSGGVKSGDDVYNSTESVSERMGHLLQMRGKDRTETDEAAAGDIAAVAKLKGTKINDIFSTKNDALFLEPIEFPTPVVPMAVIPKSKKDQDKLGIGLSKLTEIDPTFLYHIDKEFSETIVTAMGEVQIDVMIKRLKERYGVEVDLGKPHIPYRERITRKSEKQGKHKKQSGGHGQYGDCWLRLEPLSPGGGFEFVDAIVGGSIPGKYVPAVEKGVRESMQKGTLAGYPVVDLRVTVYDGSYHDVDSSDMSFQIAGSLAFKNAMAEAAPQLLEPIVDLEAYAPQEYMGDLSSDISQRRGRVSGMDSGVIRAKVPVAELYQYSAALKSITSGAGSYTMKFSHYEPIPAHIAQKVIEETKREREEREKK
ncbi:MAG: elongation factor G [Proteobacteria bacterium]|nr:elongation factor G [Pseudomonadota bacterium]